MADNASAIRSIESGGDYGILGPMTKGGHRAYGAYQVMDYNIAPWTKEVLGAPMTPQQFLASPKAQDAVFSAKFGQLISKYGNPQDAASAWFTGRPLAQGAGAKDVTGTSGAQYVARFNRALGTGPQSSADAFSRQGGQPSATPGNSGPNIPTSVPQMAAPIGGAPQPPQIDAPMMPAPPMAPMQFNYFRPNLAALLSRFPQAGRLLG